MANTTDINQIARHLEGKGEMDYDYLNDVLFFKIKDREYDFSLEFQNMVIDVDKEEFIIGIQIFNASDFLRISKINLRKIPSWRFDAKIIDNSIELRLFYQIEIRNKIVEKNPIIIQENRAGLPSPQLVTAI